jgi:prevent-host-death family protein
VTTSSDRAARTISVGELRQNPTSMLDDVASGESYVVMNRRRPIARIVPIDDDERWTANRDRIDAYLARERRLLGEDRADLASLADLVADNRAAESGPDR